MIVTMPSSEPISDLSYCITDTIYNVSIDPMGGYQNWYKWFRPGFIPE
jgi:hypothetical protein